ncbi:MAG TPA: DUF2752 domain-containing protein [Gemmataceae bacterium]|nr:DUF2752 domain-containing protein [Gemmataceae bacterium]
MIVRIQKEPFRQRSQRIFRLQGAGFIGLGIGILAVWNPLTRPGPTVCMLRRAVGLPCPMCGMTRGVALCLRCHPLEASLFNPLAVPVLLIAVMLAIKWAIECGSGRCFHVIVPAWISRNLIRAGYVLLAVNWIYMLIYRREDPFATTWLGQLWTALAGSS